MIDRKNYEIYLVDYLDGILPAKERAELEAFLLIHPELKRLLKNQTEVKLRIPSVTYPKKELLKKSAEQECPDYYAIAEAENVLSALERRQLGKASGSAAFKALTETYRHLKIKPDRNIRYGKKEVLYRKTAPVFNLWSARIAAFLVLFIGSGLFVRQTVVQNPEKLTITANLPKISPVKLLQAKDVILVSIHTATFTLKPREIVSPIPARKNIKPASAPSSFIAAVNAEDQTSVHPVAVPSPYTPEIVLNESAKEWKSSTTNFESRDIFTSVIHAGKNLAERTKKENIY